jgi:hypothetical protein
MAGRVMKECELVTIVFSILVLIILATNVRVIMKNAPLLE